MIAALGIGAGFVPAAAGATGPPPTDVVIPTEQHRSPDAGRPAGADRRAETAAAAAPATVATTGVHGLDFAGGRLNTVERSPSGDETVYERRVSADGVTVGERESRGYAGSFANGAHLRRVPCDIGDCVELVGAGNGAYGVVFVDGDGAGRESVQYRTSGDAYHGGAHYPLGTAKIVDLTGRSWVVNGGSPVEQQAGVHPSYRSTADPVVRKPTAASVWGTTLWAATAATGVLTATDLGQRKVVETVATGAPCVIKEVRAVGRWAYWNCGTTGVAGVYDRTAKKSFTVSSGPALVGDGFLVQHDRAAGTLLLTDFHTGAAAAPRAVADLPAGTTADQRRLTWTVDKFGGDIAYVDAAQSLHIVPSGVPAQPLAKIASDIGEAYMDPKGVNGPEAWLSTWQFNKPVTWTYTVKDWTGRTVRTLKGGSGSGTETGVEWDGRTDAGRFTGNGRHTWTLRATAEDGSGAYTTSGTIAVSGGTAGFHDQGLLSIGDLVTLNSAGGLTVQFGQASGSFSGKKSGSGWPAGTLAVPLADTGSDRCSELLVRMPDGELRQYAGRCGNSGYTPNSSHTTIGKGWQQYDVLTSPGDLNGDGRADLVARQTSTGDMYFYAGVAGGKFAPKARIFTNWKTYAQITGVGDITGDGRPDLLGHDRNGGLWRYNGLGNGSFAPRVKVFADWGSSYTSMVGVGDLTGDGKNDIVVRDSAGKLFRNNGNGKGSFGSRTQIAIGWTYKGIF